MSQSEQNAQADDRVYAIDTALLLCMAFADKGFLDTAILIASTFLHHATMDIRNPERRPKKSETRLRLAYRELFLLRHYCERALATEDFFRLGRRAGDPKGSVDKNFARAQRDLDFAALISEDVERCLDVFEAKTVEELDPTPSGQNSLNDGRLRLAHFGAVIDQLMIRLHEDRENRISSLDWRAQQREVTRRRLDNWVIAGLVKEISIEAHSARQRAANLAESDPGRSRIERYLNHVEARALQSALTAFAIYMTYPLSPSLHRLWTLDNQVEAEEILVFRDWERWWNRYRELRARFDFEMRTYELLDAMCSALIEIRKTTNKASTEVSGASPAECNLRTNEPIIAILAECQAKLEKIAGPTPDRRRAQGFVQRLAESMRAKLAELAMGMQQASEQGSGRHVRPKQ